MSENRFRGDLTSEGGSEYNRPGKNIQGYERIIRGCREPQREAGH